MRETTIKDPTSQFRDEMWDILAKKAEGLKGPDVVRALQHISDDLWECGFDEAYHKVQKDVNDEALASAFDFTWMTGFIVGLNRLRKKNE